MLVSVVAPTDAPMLAAMRDAAARWQQERAIRQWAPGEVTPEQFAAQAAAGEWHVAWAAEPIAAVRLLRSDALFWGAQPNRPAVHVHGLMTSRSAPGGTGALLLRWVAEKAKCDGAEVIRLDRVEDNTRLCQYYEAQGFVRVGRQTFGDEARAVALFEKRLGRE